MILKEINMKNEKGVVYVVHVENKETKEVLESYDFYSYEAAMEKYNQIEVDSKFSVVLFKWGFGVNKNEQ